MLQNLCNFATNLLNLPHLLEGLLGEDEAVQLAFFSTTVRKLSKMVKKPRQMPQASNTLLLCLLVLQLAQPTCGLLRDLQIFVNKGWTCLVITPWAWASFLPVILHFGGDISYGSLCIEVPLGRHHRFPLLCLFDTQSHQHSRQGLVMEDFLDNFLNILKLFLAVESNFTKSLWWRMDGLKRERKTKNWLCRSWWQLERGS
jgi:hypothetical protein